MTLLYAPYPGASPEAIEFVERMKNPKHLAKKVLQGSSNALIAQGVISSYAGYVEVSDVNGQTVFLRKHTNPLFYIIITPQATPIIMNSNTIDHWELEPNIPFALYKVERKLDKETGLAYWNAQTATTSELNQAKSLSQTTRPNNTIIPLESIIIFAKPKYVYIPIGISITSKSENLEFPTFYIKKGIDIAQQAFYFMNLGLYFRPLTTLYVKKELQYSTIPAS
jgi:hypothetical protein